MFRFRGSGYGDHALMAEDPCDRDLGGRGAMLFREKLEGRMVEEAALLDRRVRHNRRASFSAPRQQIVLDTAAGKVVKHFVRLYGLAARNLDEFFLIGEGKIAF